MRVRKIGVVVQCGLAVALSMPLALAYADSIGNANPAAIVLAEELDPSVYSAVIQQVPAGVELRYPTLVAKIYQQRQFQPLWNDHQVRVSLEQQINIIALADVSAWFEERARLLMQTKQEQNWLSYEVLATDLLLAYLRYQQDVVHEGKAWLFGAGVPISTFEPEPAAIARLLHAVNENYLFSWLDGNKPAGRAYDNMLAAILALQALEEAPLPTFQQAGLIRPGEALDDAQALVAILIALGDMPEYLGEALLQEVPSVYANEMVEAVERFQSRHGLKVDGIIGPNTKAWLNTPLEERVRLMALNMERLRIWSSQRDSMLVVNIPDYELTLWQENQVEFSSKVIVGRPSRRTPLLTSRLDTVVFNPPWNVPTSIMRKDILPKVKANHNYLDENNYQILVSWRSSDVIPADMINWENISVHHFPYRLRQSPGDHNALGRYKFNMPNNNAIYLHDTPAKNLFTQSQRAFSSGCIRVEGAADLADWLMDRSGVSASRVEKYEQRKTTKFVPVTKHIPVETIYQTAWFDEEEGTRQYRTDIYHYDQSQHWPFDDELLTALGL
ncbi:L,D-transpeptidase family protein [Thaumasiovibrio sp. DFM-14]|uniref:L,D-transpeptidase family protein n=1 Tax=Thaumasiovibrio sp. DFM-14 TaxID=3384792 RepID=UPI0039A3EE0C